MQNNSFSLTFFYSCSFFIYVQRYSFWTSCVYFFVLINRLCLIFNMIYIVVKTDITTSFKLYLCPSSSVYFTYFKLKSKFVVEIRLLNCVPYFNHFFRSFLALKTTSCYVNIKNCIPKLKYALLPYSEQHSDELFLQIHPEQKQNGSSM